MWAFPAGRDRSSSQDGWFDIMRLSRGLRSGCSSRRGSREPGGERGAVGFREGGRSGAPWRAGGRGRPSSGPRGALSALFSSGWPVGAVPRIEPKDPQESGMLRTFFYATLEWPFSEEHFMVRSLSRGILAFLFAAGCGPTLREVPQIRPEPPVSQKLRKVDTVVEEMIAAKK